MWNRNRQLTVEVSGNKEEVLEFLGTEPHNTQFRRAIKNLGADGAEYYVKTVSGDNRGGYEVSLIKFNKIEPVKFTLDEVCSRLEGVLCPEFIKNLMQG